MADKRRILIAVLTILISVAAVIKGGSAVEAHASETTYTFSFSGTSKITGEVGTSLSKQTMTLYFQKGVKLARELKAGTDVSGWFKGEQSPLPAGVKVTVKETALAGAASMKVEFSGTPLGSSCDNIKIVVKKYYFDEYESDTYTSAAVSFTGTIPKYAITRNFTVPSGYSGVSGPFYFKDQVSGTAGWTLTGEKNVALSGNNELSVVIKGNFLVSLSAGTDISSWFTGSLYNYESLLKRVRNSWLPSGVTAKIKSSVKAGDNSFTIVFSGTPLKGSIDLISFTIPQNYVSWYKSYNYGDSVEALTVTNTSGKYAYDINGDPEDLYGEIVEITLPEATLEVGKDYFLDDDLIVTYKLVGQDSSGNPVRFTDRVMGNDIKVGLCWQEVINGKAWTNDVITTYTGLQGKIYWMSNDKTEIKAKLYGSPTDQRWYPYHVGGTGFILHTANNSAGKLIEGIFTNSADFQIVEPTLDVTITGDVSITKAESDSNATVTNQYITINLGTDTIAEDMKKGTCLPLFYPESRNPNDKTRYDGVYISLTQDAKKGDSILYARVFVMDSEMRSTWKGRVRLAFPKELITRLKQYGTQNYYSIPDSHITVDVVVAEEPTTYSCYCTPTVIRGKLNNEMVCDENNLYLGMKINPIGTEKVYFDITIIDPDYLRMNKAYKAGDSVTDFITMYFEGDYSKDPFLRGDRKFIPDPGDDFKLVDIVTTEDIEIAPGDGPRVFHLMIDLSKTYAVQQYQGQAFFQIAMKGGIIQVQNNQFFFEITKAGPHEGDDSGSGSQTIENTEPDGQPDIWINGKDNKNAGNYYKTMNKELATLITSLPEGCKYIVSVTDTDVDDVANAFGTGGKGKKSNIAKASVKAKDGVVSVSAGKKAGNARIWVAAYDTKEKKVESSAYFDVKVGTAPKKLYLTEDGTGAKAEAVKTIMLNKGDMGSVYVNADGTVLSRYTTFTWEAPKDTDGLLSITPSSGAKQSALIGLNSAPTDGKVKKIAVNAINNESGKKVSVSVQIVNSVKSITGLSNALQLSSAADSAVEAALDYSLVCYSSDGATTDKIKVYVTTALEEGEGYTLTGGKKFTQSASSKSKVKVTYKDGAFTLKAPKKTADGTKVRVLIVATHADKTIDVYESGVITIGTASSSGESN